MVIPQTTTIYIVQKQNNMEKWSRDSEFAVRIRKIMGLVPIWKTEKNFKLRPTKSDAVLNIIKTKNVYVTKVENVDQSDEIKFIVTPKFNGLGKLKRIWNVITNSDKELVIELNDDEVKEMKSVLNSTR